MIRSWFRIATFAAGLAIALLASTPSVLAQSGFPFRSPFVRSLPASNYVNGSSTLRAFAPVSKATRYSVVSFNVDGTTVALGTVMDTNGLVLTKASELKKGKLTCLIATNKEVAAEVLGTDSDEDLALVHVNTTALKPVQWTEEDVTIGEWAVTPGIAENPDAVGIISALPRRIRPRRALIGIQFSTDATTSRIDQVMPGLGAEKAGVKSGDVIVAINSTSVTNRVQVTEIVRELKEGQVVTLRVKRADQELEMDVTLMPEPAQTEAVGPGSSRQRNLNRVTGEVSVRADGFERAIEHDTVLLPSLCGGPLVNLEGKAIGLNIARAGRVSSYALPAELVLRVFDQLRAQPVSIDQDDN